MTRSYEIQPDPQDLPIPIVVDISSPQPEFDEEPEPPLPFSQRASIVRRVARAEVAGEVSQIRERARMELAAVEAARALELAQARERARRSIRRSSRLSAATGVVTSVLAMVLCINFQPASLEADSGGGTDPSVSFQLDHWIGSISGESVSAVPEPEAQEPARVHASSYSAKVTSAAEPITETEFPTTNCGDPNDPLNFCL